MDPFPSFYCIGSASKDHNRSRVCWHAHVFSFFLLFVLYSFILLVGSLVQCSLQHAHFSTFLSLYDYMYVIMSLAIKKNGCVACVIGLTTEFIEGKEDCYLMYDSISSTSKSG